ncbi:MAG: IS66 family insertion sequence element accessory protein TnpB [Puniceicoccaceae bacterium]
MVFLKRLLHSLASKPPLELSLPESIRTTLAVKSEDTRGSYNGLWSLAEQHLREDPRAGAFYLFSNRSYNRINIAS